MRNFYDHLIKIDERRWAELDKQAKKESKNKQERITRSSIIRMAVDQYLKKNSLT